MSDITSLLKIINKDFDLPENLNEDQLLEVMVNAFAYLIDEDFQKLLQILYKADVDQDKLKILLENTANSSSAEIIAQAYIARQKAKIETWKKYSNR
ncbi:hypothetical protein [Pedobacter boryungensis]|uniref:Uncharacterized protein n=1 Tax=Pedobacter boryungensis TaxID=869962 RepID=A0ABX2DAR9_9SPHI|nr:hypothetical protein [Pedobacter boryungensis]NQX31157.1 hypothetical protein [Pedobacter boryungensis]